jgi:Poly A polymerase head domain/Probable RNA and SrmB- binding site of polymerase A
MKTISLPPAAWQIIDALYDAGGEPFVVGGFVRDSLLDIPSKDLDIEVFKIPLDAVQTALETLGKVDAVGKSFGVFKLSLDGWDFDVSLPRTEVKEGVGHTGFAVIPDFTLFPAAATLRRDFTINALMFDPVLLEVLDFHGGLSDLEEGIIRHVSPAFAEDPLRVLRAAQFAARFDFVVAWDTVLLCRSLLPEFKHLAKERVFEEIRKMFLRGKNVNRGFEVLNMTGWGPLVGFKRGLSMNLARREAVLALGLTPGQTFGTLMAMVTTKAEDLVETNEEKLWARKVLGAWEQADMPLTLSEMGGLSRKLAPVTLRTLGAATGRVFCSSSGVVSSALDGPEPLLVTGERVQRVAGLPTGKAIGEIIRAAEEAQTAGTLTEKGADAFILGAAARL